MDSATADTVSAQPELQLLLCLAAIANALNGELQPRTFRAGVSRREAKRQLEVASDLLSLLSAQRSVQTSGRAKRRLAVPYRATGQTNRNET
jgi:hypothetical protein